jgi:hypothetical protein
MKRPAASRNALFAAALIAAALAFSCAAPIQLGKSVDPLALLATGCSAYARVSGQAARDLAPDLLGPSDLASAKSLLSRTRIIALGIGPRGDEGRMPFQAALVGDYPFRAASLSLGANREWKREKGSFYNARLGLRAAVPGPSLVLASSGPVEGLVEAAASSARGAPPASPLPARLSPLSSAELVLWIPDPFAAIAREAAGEGMEVPARGLLIAASPNAPGRDEYVATVAFLMESPEAVRIFKPALRLAWYAIASAALGDEGKEAARASFSAKDELYVAEGVVLARGALVRALKGGVGGILGGSGEATVPGAGL